MSLKDHSLNSVTIEFELKQVNFEANKFEEKHLGKTISKQPSISTNQ